MAKVRWTGRAQAVAQVETITIGGTIAIGDTFSVTINKKTVTYTAAAATIADVTAGLTKAMNDRSAPAEFREVTWVDSSPDIVGTGTAGVPFTCTVSKNSAAGTITRTTTTAATGPNHWDNGDNWDTGSVPAAADDVFIDGTGTSILYGLNQSAIGLSSLVVGSTFTGTIGLPKQNPAGYVEYRDEYLQIGATTVKIGTGDGSGSGRIKIDLGSGASSVSVWKSGASLETGLPAVILLGSNISTLEVGNGSCGLAVFGGETGTAVSVLVGAGGYLFLGQGSSVQTVTSSGRAAIECDVTTLTVDDGTCTVRGEAAITTLSVNGGTCQYESSGTITTLTVSAPIDFSGDASLRTVTTATLKAGGRIVDPYRSVTFTNGIQVGSSVDEVYAA